MKYKYYKRFFLREPGDPTHYRAYQLFRVSGVRVERYAGMERWVEHPYAGKVLLDISGAGGSWYDIKEITPEEAEEIKKQLFDENGKRIAPV